jgi:hypothetical protein
MSGLKHYLIFSNEEQSRPMQELQEGDNLLGANSQICDIEIKLPYISDIHAKIIIDPSAAEYSIEDLASEHGTFKRGVDGQMQRLRVGKIYDLIEGVPFFLGKHYCEFRLFRSEVNVIIRKDKLLFIL